MHDGVDGLLRDKSRPPGKAPVPSERVAEIVRLTQEPPPHAVTRWTARAMAMRAEDVTDTLDLALAASGCDSAKLLNKPRLLSDNGPSYIAGELAEYSEAQKMSHVRGAPMDLKTQGKIERWHQTLKNCILLENYFLPGDLEAQIEAFVEHYNHESLSNVTPVDAYFGRAPAIIKQRETIKRQTIEHRSLQHRKLAA